MVIFSCPIVSRGRVVGEMGFLSVKIERHLSREGSIKDGASQGLEGERETSKGGRGAL